MDLVEKLISIRAKNHWTQKELAERLHVTPLTISNIETGKQKKVNKVLGYNIDLLIKSE
ncbi:MAG: helix-turn-helix transcriptional regulator [Lachnospiraceae bacterium]|nr:helix-turn-helix transcriptional regulator [Lachnospiraceae bacterium]